MTGVCVLLIQIWDDRQLCSATLLLYKCFSDVARCPHPSARYRPNGPRETFCRKTEQHRTLGRSECQVGAGAVRIYIAFQHLQ